MVPRTVRCSGYGFLGHGFFAWFGSYRDWDVGVRVKRGNNGEMQRV